MARRRPLHIPVAALLVASAALVVGTGVIAPGPAHAECSLSPTTGSYTDGNGVTYPGVEERFYLSQGNNRRYLLKVPSGLSGPAPLLLVLHGLSHTPDNPLDYAPWETMADTNKFVVAYPDAGDKRWDYDQNSADVVFIRDLAGHIGTSYCLDATHLHITGDSRGAIMSQRMACDEPDVFASVGSYAGSDPTLFNAGPCQPAEPISLIMFHGTNDTVVSYKVGVTARDNWAKRLSCPAPVTTQLSDGKLLTYSPCWSGQAELQWREYQGETHLSTWGNKAEDMSTRQWDFFMAHPL